MNFWSLMNSGKAHVLPRKVYLPLIHFLAFSPLLALLLIKTFNIYNFILSFIRMSHDKLIEHKGRKSIFLRFIPALFKDFSFYYYRKTVPFQINLNCGYYYVLNSQITMIKKKPISC